MSIEHLLGLRVHGDVEIPDGEGGWRTIKPTDIHVGTEPPADTSLLWINPDDELRYWDDQEGQWKPILAGGIRGEGINRIFVSDEAPDDLVGDDGDLWFNKSQVPSDLFDLIESDVVSIVDAAIDAHEPEVTVVTTVGDAQNPVTDVNHTRPDVDNGLIWFIDYDTLGDQVPTNMADHDVAIPVDQAE